MGGVVTVARFNEWPQGRFHDDFSIDTSRGPTWSYLKY